MAACRHTSAKAAGSRQNSVSVGCGLRRAGATGGAVERKKKEAKKKENEEARGNCRRYGKNQNAIRQLLG